MAITVIDSIMGSGKTQAMYIMIRSHPEQSFMIVTPYRATIKDAIKELPNMYQPEYKGGNKLDDLKRLLSHGKNIVCTHSLFLNVDNEVWDLVRDGGYTLFIDEVLDVIKPINDIIDDVGYRVKNGTASFLIKANVISVDEKCRVSWHFDEMAEDYEYRYLEPIVKTGNVLCAEGKLFLWMFPPQIFEAFRDIYILSYLFEGSVFDAYLKIHGFKYTIGGVSGSYGSEGGYHFTDYRTDIEERRRLCQLINVYTGKANAIGDKRSVLSATWYDNATSADIKAVSTGFNTFLKKAKSKFPDWPIMWTAFKDERETLAIKGAKYVRRLTAEENTAMEADPDYKNPELNKLRCFLSCNARATNDYDDRRVLAYLINKFYNPVFRRMFKNVYNITLNEERYALSEMIQWIWRSKLRRSNIPDEDRAITIYIPSKRMRDLLNRWLAGEAI